MADLTGPNPDEIDGDTAHDAVDSGNPIKIGGFASSAIPAVVQTGDRVNAWYGLSGQQVVSLSVGTSTAAADGVNQVGLSNLNSAAASYLPIGVAGYVYNGTNFDRARSGGVTGMAGVSGDTAHNAADAGNPAKIGGYGSAAIPTAISGDGNRVNGWFTTRGALNVRTVDGNGASIVTAAATLADGITNPTLSLIGAANVAFNGTTWDRARAIASLSTAPNVDTGILAVGDGPGWDRKNDPAGVPATGTSGTTNAVTVPVNGADVVTFHVTAIGTTPGSMIIETTADDTNWATAGAVLKLGVEQWVNGSFVPAVNDVYMVRTTGLRQVRYRVNAAYASGTATVKVTGSVGAALVKGIDVAAAPHNIGYTVSSFSNKFTSTQTSINLIAGTAGKRIYVTGLRIATGGTTAGRVSIYWGTGAFTAGTSPTLFDGEFIPSATAAPGAVIPLPWAPGASSATGDNLRITTSAGITVYVTIDYYVA